MRSFLEKIKKKVQKSVRIRDRKKKNGRKRDFGHSQEEKILGWCLPRTSLRIPVKVSVRFS